MDWSTVDSIIFDVDGTLYSQRRVRINMAWRLLIYYMGRPHKMRELFGLYLFRKLRENPTWKNASDSELFYEIEKRTHLPSNIVAQTICRWMFQNPLDLLQKYAYHDVIDWVNAWRATGKQIVIYSDYPAEEKLNALGMQYDKLFCFGQDGIDEHKPSEKIMRRITSEVGSITEKMLYVGDRDSKDGASAQIAHIRYVNIHIFRKMISSAQK